MKFVKGEIAIHIGQPGRSVCSPCEAEIIECGPWRPRCKLHPKSLRPNGEYADYLVQIEGRGICFVTEAYLRKRPGKDDNLFTQWFESHIITDIRPTERQVREGLKGILHPFGEKAGEKL